MIGGHEYDVRCNIYKISNNETITSKGIFLNTKLRGISVKLNLRRLVIAVNDPISLIALFQNSDNIPGILSVSFIIITRNILQNTIVSILDKMEL